MTRKAENGGIMVPNNYLTLGVIFKITPPRKGPERKRSKGPQRDHWI